MMLYVRNLFPYAINNIKTCAKRKSRWLELKMRSLPQVRSNSPILDSHMSAPRERDNACWRQSTAITNKELPLLTLYRLKAVCLLTASIEYALRVMYRNTSLRCG
ncbi:hypothetical protein AVEN_145001-1 [Araneus ventricosus]|uniref:Uncharacterized protein n=1 Tax=Araneus ventricosus TaxID=182803 RepID=A0A4Y2PNB1_ARAVE|nr:hypothetical protein AVEN_145001-1 [Araneus ventricosus]